MKPPSSFALRSVFLLTPLREGRLLRLRAEAPPDPISTHAPAGGATFAPEIRTRATTQFLLTPLREGRHLALDALALRSSHFYSRPCGRGDAGGADNGRRITAISTHAPAGGAT